MTTLKQLFEKRDRRRRRAYRTLILLILLAYSLFFWHGFIKTTPVPFREYICEHGLFTPLIVYIFGAAAIYSLFGTIALLLKS